MKNCIYGQRGTSRIQNFGEKQQKSVFLELSFSFFFVFWSFSRALSCLERSGKVLGFISTKFRPNPRSWDRVMTKKRFIQGFLRIFFEIVNFIFLWFLVVILVPELFKEVRETPGINFHQVSSKSEAGCPSYDQKT